MRPQIAPITAKRWVGTADERFKHTDMIRAEANGNHLANFIGFAEITYLEKTRASQFRYDEMQKIERLSRDMAIETGEVIATESDWGHGRTVNYHDFERLERGQHDIYTALDGRCGRVAWNEILNVHDLVLYEENWAGIGPYTYTLEIPTALATDEAYAYIREDSTVLERVAEYNAVMMPSLADGQAAIKAYGVRPTMDMTLRVARRKPKMYQTFTINAAAWTGTGPWTTTITASNIIATGVVMLNSSATEAQAIEYMEAGIAPSAVSGKVATIRAIRKKPTADIPIVLMYEDSIGMIS